MKKITIDMDESHLKEHLERYKTKAIGSSAKSDNIPKGTLAGIIIIQ